MSHTRTVRPDLVNQILALHLHLDRLLVQFVHQRLSKAIIDHTTVDSNSRALVDIVMQPFLGISPLYEQNQIH